MQLLKNSLIIGSILLSSAAYANGPALNTTKGITQIRWCCAVTNVKLTSTGTFSDESKTNSQNNDHDDCNASMSGNHGQDHGSLSNGIVTGIWSSASGSGDWDAGVNCKRIVVERQCGWYKSTDDMCQEKEQNKPLPAGGVDPAS